MSELHELIEHLQETGDALAHLRDLGADQADDIARINMASVARRQADLVRKVEDVLSEQSRELVRYRIMRDWSDSYPAKAVAASLTAFQELVTAVFDAVRTAPKLRYRPSAENVELSTFDFAGAYAGSVMVSLSVPTERLLLGETDLEQTFALVERALSARASEDLKLLAEKIGVASIAKAYSWADASVQYGIDTEIRWGRALSETHDLTISRSEAETVRMLIEDRSETTSDTQTFDGTLLGFDGDTSYFHIETLGEKTDIRGDLAPGLPKVWTTSQPYRARILRTAQVRYATGEEKVTWTLLSLEPLPSYPALTDGSA